jgi:biotin transport system substrate-specific component
MSSITSAASVLPALFPRALAALAGALAVALAAQVAVPLPGTPVPVSLAPLAVVLVGGLLGARVGAAALVTYLVMGAAGLPVFAPGGLPGAARLFGPTGGFLLAYPLAAALAGIVTARGAGWVRVLAAPALGMLAIHAGGVAQLLVLTGSASLAVALGTLPFVAGDLLKVGVAALVLRCFAGSTRALRG